MIRCISALILFVLPAIVRDADLMAACAGCDGGSGSTFGNLGQMYVAGDGVVANDALADRYFNKACKLGVVSTC